MSGSVRNSSAKTKAAGPPVDSDEVRKAGEEITASYKLLEKAWKKAEAKLALAHVPEEVKVRVAGQSYPEGESVTYLAYSKVKGNWRICIIEVENYYPDPEQDSH